MSINGQSEGAQPNALMDYDTNTCMELSRMTECSVTQVSLLCQQTQFNFLQLQAVEIFDISVCDQINQMGGICPGI